jgi:hypothetical protein
MTSHEVVNQCVAVGLLELDRRDRDRRSALRGVVTQASIQLLTPFGQPFAIALTLPGVVESSHKLVSGARVAVEGQVRLERGFDRRFAHEGEARGAQTRQMQFVVARVRDAADDEPLGASFVQLIGTVLDPPHFVAHPQVTGVRLALVRFGVTQERAAPYPGSAIVRQERSQVTVAVPTDHADAGLLYRPGNVVRIEGELDCVLVELRGRGADELAVRRVREQWDEVRAQVQGDPREEEQAYRCYLAQLRRFSDTPRWRVLVGHIEPAGEAEAISQGQARRLRAQWAHERDGVREPAAAEPAPEGERENDAG